MRPKPNLVVIQWLDEQMNDELFLPAIVKAEIKMGIAILDNGKTGEKASENTQLIQFPFLSNALS